MRKEPMLKEIERISAELEGLKSEARKAIADVSDTQEIAKSLIQIITLTYK